MFLSLITFVMLSLSSSPQFISQFKESNKCCDLMAHHTKTMDKEGQYSKIMKDLLFIYLTYFQHLGNGPPSSDNYPSYFMKLIIRQLSQNLKQNKIRKFDLFIYNYYQSQEIMKELKLTSKNKNLGDINKLDIEFHLNIKSGARTNSGYRLKTKSLHRGETQKSEQNYQSIVDKIQHQEIISQAKNDIDCIQPFSNTVHNVRYEKQTSIDKKMSKTRSEFNNKSMYEENKVSLSFTKCPSFIPKNQRSSSMNMSATHSHLNHQKSKIDSLDPFQIKWIGAKPVNVGSNFNAKNIFPTRKKKSGTQMLINMLMRHANRQQMQVMRYKKINQQAQQKQNAKSKPKYGYLSQINNKNLNNSHLRNRMRNQHHHILPGSFKFRFSSSNNT